MGLDTRLAELQRLEAAAQKLRAELGVDAPTPPALSKREALLVEAERVAHLGSWTWNLDTNEIVWSDELYRILGLSVQSVEPNSERYFAAIHPEDRERVQESTRRSLRAGIPEVIEFRLVRPDGEVRQVRMDAAFVRDASGSTKHVVGTVLDETDKREAAALLARALAELNDAHRIAGLGSWRWELANRHSEWSEGMYRILGIADRPAPSEELFVAHVHPADLGRLRETARRAIASGVGEQLDLRIARDDGAVRYVIVRSRAILDETGKFCGFRGVLQDVTERRALEERVRHSQKMEAVGTLAGGVAHDFNNYLLIVGGYVDLLEAQGAFRGAAQASLDAIRHACSRCALLTQQLLTLSRRRQSQPRWVSLRELIENMAPTLHSLLGATVALKLEIAQELAPIIADPSQLDQVLMNLVINARDAMSEGGVLTISLQNVRAQERIEWVKLTVRDTGCGISEELRERIFEPFFTTKPFGRGTGLGLAIVYGLVQEAGGTIELESEPGVGSAFQVYFRPANADGPQEPEPVITEALQGHGERVLVVDDVEQVRELVSAQLSQAGYEVLNASDGEAALALLTEERVDAVLSDVVMPKMGGLRLFAELRARYPGLPCLLMTGYSPETLLDTDPPLEAPMLQKPFSTRELLSALARLLRSCVPRAP